MRHVRAGARVQQYGRHSVIAGKMLQNADAVLLRGVRIDVVPMIIPEGTVCVSVVLLIA
jgi:hypothetical protein